MTGKGKTIAVAAALCITLGLTVVPVAAGYSVPVGHPHGPPGSPGGQPTKPKGGSPTSKRLAEDAGLSIAGYTGLELALRTPLVRFNFPEAGLASCTVSNGKSTIGSGSVSKSSKGDATFPIYFTNHGRRFLYEHNGQPISLTVTCDFVPKHGVEATSTSTVVLDP